MSLSKFDYDEQQRRQEERERSQERRARFTPPSHKAIQEALLANDLKRLAKEESAIDRANSLPQEVECCDYE